ncbi:MAG: hypothetical protein HY010_05750 [Acidobacteria bacterium]|nr:hypothetical protein [Acidobacteriota bacterium]
MAKSFLGNKPPILEFSVMVGVQSETVTLEQGNVVGRWADNSVDFIDLKSPLLCEKFANWQDTPEGIVAFTKKYGPLLLRPCFREERGHTFSFTVDDWRSCQASIRRLWNLKAPNLDIFPDELAVTLKRSIAEGTFVDSGTAVTVQSDEVLQFYPGKATLRVNTLARLIELEVSACPREYLKVCRFCQTCFIEPDKRVVYCGKRKCRSQGKNESNRIAWHRNKAKWTKKHKSE